MTSGPQIATRCAVLVGGAGSRLGGDKHLVPLGGIPLAAHAIGTAAEAGMTPVLVAKPATVVEPLLELSPGLEVLREPAEPRHPLVGVLAALEAGPGPTVTIPCDLPLVSVALLSHLAAADGTTVVAGPAGPEPLLGRFEPAAAAGLRTAIDSGGSARDAVAALGAKTLEGAELAALGDAEQLLLNVNTPDDLARAARLLRR